MARIGEVGEAVERAVEARRSFTESLPGGLEDKQSAIAAAMLKVGPPTWRVKTEICHVLPCDSCEEHCLQAASAEHDIVNHRAGKPLHDPGNMRRFKAEVASIPVPEDREAINIPTGQAHADTKMAFTFRGKGRELVRLYAAGSLGGGIGFALVDHFGVQMIPNVDANVKDGVHAAIGVVITLAGAYFNRLWLAELGASYTAVPVARLTQRNALGGVPVGQVRFAPTGIPGGIQINGRVGAVPTTVSGVKTF